MKKIKLQKKITISFLTIALLPLFFISIFSYFSFKNALIENQEDSLMAINHAKKEAIKNFFKRIKIEIDEGAHNPVYQHAYDLLKKYHDDTRVSPTGNFNVQSKEYQKIWEKVDKSFRHFIDKYNFYDVFLICAQHGHVMYTHAKEADFGENLHYGRLNDSVLARSWEGGKNGLFITDFKKYAPSNNKAFAFLSHPIEKNGTIIGVLVLQISSKMISDVMSGRDGLGESGESFLVGQDGLMRSNSYHDPQNYSVQASFAQDNKINGESFKKAMQGKAGIEIVEDSNGHLLISSYDSFEFIGQEKWAVITNIELEEVMKPLSKLGLWTLLVVMAVIIATLIFSIFLIRNLNFFAYHLVNSSNFILNAANQMAGGNQDLSSRTQQQASSLEETASTVEEITTRVQQTSDMTQDASKFSTEALSIPTCDGCA